VFSNLFGQKRDEMTGGWRKLHNEELLNLCSSPSIIRMVKSRRMRGTGHVARMREKANAYRVLVGNQMERDHWKDHNLGGWTILKLILKRDRMGWNGLD
jgi:hypothetical protein